MDWSKYVDNLSEKELDYLKFASSKEQKLQLVKDVLGESKSSYLSDYDIIQRFLFMVERPSALLREKAIG